ncbi:MAG TPA: tetratricopeptide repeat protein [Pyrinomonadaceae bacterium]|nr:tetratricopeptide repeat protein [Pyrinomonadaceae bacterium]
MAFEKAKVLKAAEKFLSQGKINAAIKEYRQIIENDGDDLTTLNMLGDLCVRAKLNDEAISCFSRIAEHYREREFNLKAIAMYKKIERLTPHDPAIALKLGSLYSLQGLVADAKAQFLTVADAYTRAGKTKQTLEVLHKVADLDPNNTEIRLKLAAGYLKESLNEEAARAFSDAGSRLFDTAQFDKALSAYQKTLELFPNDERALKGVVSAHVALGEADEAAELLERLVADRPGDPDLVQMLARTYIDAENPQGAERATEILFKQDPANYPQLLEVAKLYLKTGEVNDATRVLASIVEQLLAGREENDLLELLNEGLARNPEHVEALRLLVRVYWWQRDMENLRQALERLAEAAEAAGLVEDERYALTQLLRLIPNERYSERLIALGGSPDEPGDGVGLQTGSAVADTPIFDNFAITNRETETLPGVEETIAAVEFEWNSVAEQTPQDPSASFADLNEDAEETNLLADAGSESSREEIIDEDARREAVMKQELESVDFYITQGYEDIANDTLELMERQFGSRPEIIARRQKLKETLDAKSPSQADASTFDFGSAEQFESAAEVSPDVEFAFAGGTDNGTGGHAFVPLAGETKGLDAGLAEIFEEFRQAAEDEPEAKEDFETHYNMGTAYKEMDLIDEAIMEFQTAAGLTVPTDGSSRYLQCCNMLGHCFMQKELPRAAVLWFKKGLDAPGQGEEESKALRYELGAAYEQMGDLSRACDLFTEVYGMDVAYRGVGERLQDLEQKRANKKRKK